MKQKYSPETMESVLLAYDAGWRPKTPLDESLLKQAQEYAEEKKKREQK